MAKKRKPTTPKQAEYKKQRARIQRGIKRLEARGYLVPSLLPDIPKTISKASIRRLEKIDIDYIFRKSKYIDQQTGELVSSKKGKALEDKAKIVARNERSKLRREQKAQYEQQQRAQQWDRLNPPMPTPVSENFPEWAETVKRLGLPSAADIIIGNFRGDVIGHFPAVAGPIVSQWLDRLLSMYDKEDVAIMLQDASDNGAVINYQVAYNTELILSAIAEMMTYLPEASEGFRNELIEKLEQGEDWDTPN